MSPARYRKLLSELGMSQVGAAHFLGISPRQSRNFAAGDRHIPDSVAMLLEIMREHKIHPILARSLANLTQIPNLNLPAGRPKATP